VGALWENYFIAERIKFNHYNNKYVKSYFWRSFQQQEIDLVECENGLLTAYEMKWNPRKNSKIPKTFMANYELKDSFTVSPNNYFDYLMNW